MRNDISTGSLGFEERRGMEFIIKYGNKIHNAFKSLPVILLVASLSVFLFACNSSSDIATEEPLEEAARPESLNTVRSGSGLDFNSTLDDFTDKLGTPSAIQTAHGINIYYFNGDKNEEYSGNRIYFIGEKLYKFEIVNDKLTTPNNIGIGDNIVTALQAYYIPEELRDLGINESDTEEEMLAKLNSEGDWGRVYLSDYEDSRVALRFTLPEGTIIGIEITRGKEKSGPIRIEASDFTASAEEIAEKFGYPDYISIDNEKLFTFDYRGDKKEIQFIDTPSGNANSFSVSDNWTAPIDVKIGDPIRDVFEKLYLPKEVIELGIDASTDQETATKILQDASNSYIQFDMLNYYNLLVIIDESGLVSYISISKFDNPQYQVTGTAGIPEVPPFDKEAIVVYEDLYISGCALDSNRLEVFSVFGNPEKTSMSYGEFTENAQDCYFGNSIVRFLYIDDYDDPGTGNAYQYLIRDPEYIGPRGLRVGDNVEKILEVIPGRDDIDFKTITEPTAVYKTKEYDNDVTDSAWVYPSENKAYTGHVYVNVIWYIWVTFYYHDGIITCIDMGYMLT